MDRATGSRVRWRCSPGAPLSTALSPARAARVGYEFARSIPGLKPLQALPALVGLGSDREELLTRPSLVAPRSILNEPITAHRRWAFGAIPLATVKAVKDAAGVTVNDVVIAISAGAVRRWMLEQTGSRHVLSRR